MSAAFEELDYRQTSLGELILRRRQVASLGGIDVYEVKLGGRFLMSSLVNESEVALAKLALNELSNATCDVLIGGLGLGYTAGAALEFPNVRSVTVVEYLAEVIEWHRRGLVPLSSKLTGNPRCRLIHADFFAMFGSNERGGEPPGPRPAVGPSAGQAPSGSVDASELGGDQPAGGSLRAYDAVLLDIDHSPACVLHPSHAAFYEPTGLETLAGRLRLGGVFALWSADPPDEAFTAALKRAFSTVKVHSVGFFNPLLNEQDANTVYVARRGRPAD